MGFRGSCLVSQNPGSEAEPLSRASPLPQWNAVPVGSGLPVMASVQSPENLKANS